MKLVISPQRTSRRRSHPTRGAWIEIGVDKEIVGVVAGRTPPGVRGLKLPHQGAEIGHKDVAPHTGCVD